MTEKVSTYREETRQSTCKEDDQPMRENFTRIVFEADIPSFSAFLLHWHSLHCVRMVAVGNKQCKQ